MNFKESIIIPLSMFQQCQFKNENDPETQILLDPALPSDLKLKLYDQQRQLKPDNNKLDNLVSSDIEKYPNIPTIIDSVPEKDQPMVTSILDKIIANPEHLFWNNNFEITLDGKFIPLSNIIDIMQLMMKNRVVTSDRDIPIATKQVVQKLLEIGTPRSWIKATFQTRKSHRKKKSQMGSGIKWSVFQ